MDNTTALLKNWQADFAQSLLDELTPSLQSTFQGSTEANQQRFSIYKNNVFYSLSNALAELYPVIKQLVGEDFFMATAHYYLRENPPAQAAMVHFGSDFAHFLDQFEHTKTMPYLADVARLELARHVAYHASDSPTLLANDIANINPEQLAAATIKFHPSLQLVKSDYAIFSIWEINQQKTSDEEKISINEPQQVLVVRPLYDINMYTIDTGTYRLINYLKQGYTVESAAEQTLELLPNYDISHGINFVIQENLLTAIDCATPNKPYNGAQ